MKTTRYVTFTAIGIALYVALSMVAKIPLFVGHLAFDLGYIVMAVYAMQIGAVSAAIVGGCGCVAVSMLASGWFPAGWLLGNIIIGLICGSTYDYKRPARNIIITILAVFLGILSVKTLIECSLYEIPFLVKLPKNLVAATVDAITMSFGAAFARLTFFKFKKIFYK